MKIELSDKEFKQIREFVYSRFGINLTEQKRPLVLGRLQQVVENLGLKSFSEYYEYLQAEQTGEALTTLVNRISTNHTFFYREAQHYEFMIQEILPSLKRRTADQGAKRLRIWCAGCSSGEEPYTLSMTLHEFFKNDISSWDIAILATDISERVLELAQKGIYLQDNLAHLPKGYLRRYFKNQSERSWQVVDSVKQYITFKRFNLMRTQFPFKGKFDIIFCRNVMIYFDKPTCNALVERYYRFTESGGYLFIGHSETLGRDDSSYTYKKPATYRKEPLN